MIDSTKIKYALLQHFGFKKGYYVCTELSYAAGIADVFCINKHIEKNDIIDIEIKISKADFLNDFKHKEFKHAMFKNMIERNVYINNYPNRFYFCVPDYLTEFVEMYLKENKLDYYGLIEYKEVFTNIHNKDKELVSILDEDSLLRVVKPAKKFTKCEINIESYTMMKDFMFNRLRNDTIGFYREKVYGKRYGRITENDLH